MVVTPTVTMFSVRAAEVLCAEVASPPYVAVRESVPTVLMDVLRVATPEAFRVTVPSEAGPFRKVTEPVGVPADLVTVAVSVKLSPTPADTFDDESVVVVGSGGGTVPLPLSATVCGEPVALSVTDSVAERTAAAVGLKVIETVQPAPTARLDVQLLDEIANEDGLAPAIATMEIVTGPVPALVTVTVCAAVVVPVTVEPNPRLVGETVRSVVRFSPVPARLTV